MEAGKGGLQWLPTRASGHPLKAQAILVDVFIQQNQSMLLVWMLGVVSRQLHVASSFIVVFGHKYDSILLFLPTVGHDAAVEASRVPGGALT